MIRETNLGPLSRILTREVPDWHTDVQTDPFPYFVADNVIDGNVLQEMRENWPERSSFHAEVKGNYVCDLAASNNWKDSRVQFWKHFMDGAAKTVIAKSLSMFQPWIERRYGDAEIFMAYVSLMEAIITILAG